MSPLPACTLRFLLLVQVWRLPFRLPLLAQRYGSCTGDLKFSQCSFPEFVSENIGPNVICSQLVRSIGNGTKILHSTYPWVDETSENYQDFADANLFVLDAATGLPAKRSPAPGGYFIDPFIPEAREKVSAVHSFPLIHRLCERLR